jgi:SLOG cluster2
MAEIARYILASGGDLVYGGDLRPGGFTELLFELADRHRLRGDKRPRIENVLAWPVHISMDMETLEKTRVAIQGVAKLVLLNLDGERISFSARKRLRGREPTAKEWECGLTALRSYLVRTSDARVALGGQVSGFKGVMPGIAEEALLSIGAQRSLYLIGGFGGCARDIAASMGFVDIDGNAERIWPGRDRFTKVSSAMLNNELSASDNQVLALTPHIEEAVTLILSGLIKRYPIHVNN